MSVPTTNLGHYYPGVGIHCAVATGEIQDGAITSAKVDPALLASMATNPMTTPGDVIYGGTSGAPARLGGNTAASNRFLRSTGTGSAAQAPSWQSLSITDTGLGKAQVVWQLGTLGGAKNAYTVAAPGGQFPSPRPNGTCCMVCIGAGIGNDGASTLNLGGEGAIAIVDNKGAALSGGELVEGCYILLVWNQTATQWQMV